MYPFDSHICEVTLDLGTLFNSFEFGNVNPGWPKNIFQGSDNDPEDKSPIINVPVTVILPAKPMEAVVLTGSGWSVNVSNFTLITSGSENNRTRKLSSFIKFKRNLYGIFMHFYLTSLILCIASTLSLFIHQDLWPARMCLSVTSCLTLITLVMGAK